MRHYVRGLLALAVLGVVGCTGSISQQGTTTYEARGGVTIDQVAIMPVRTVDDAEGFQRAIERIIYEQVSQRYGKQAVIPASKTREALSEASLAEEYANLMTDYDETGVLDSERLQKIANAVGANHLLHVTARYWESTRGLQEDYRQRMTMEGKILSADAGDVVWEGQGEVDRPVNDEIESGATVEKIARSATTSFVRALP